MEIFFIVLVTLCTLGSQLLIKAAVTKLDLGLLDGHKMAFLFDAVTSPQIMGAILLQGTGFLLWIFVVSRMKLGVAFAISGGIFYLLIAASSWWLYGERLTSTQWVGLACVSLGVVLVNLGSAS